MNHAVWASDISPSEARRLCARYLGSIAFIDDCIGRILNAVEARPDAGTTLICFFSDHGDHLGDHGAWQKESFCEASGRVPLLVSWPGRLPADTRFAGLAAMTDLFGLAMAASGAAELRNGHACSAHAGASPRRANRSSACRARRAPATSNAWFAAIMGSICVARQRWARTALQSAPRRVGVAPADGRRTCAGGVAPRRSDTHACWAPHHSAGSRRPHTEGAVVRAVSPDAHRAIRARHHRLRPGRTSPRRASGRRRLLRGGGTTQTCFHWERPQSTGFQAARVCEERASFSGGMQNCGGTVIPRRACCHFH